MEMWLLDLPGVGGGKRGRTSSSGSAFTLTIAASASRRLSSFPIRFHFLPGWSTSIGDLEDEACELSGILPEPLTLPFGFAGQLLPMTTLLLPL